MSAMETLITVELDVTAFAVVAGTVDGYAGMLRDRGDIEFATYVEAIASSIDLQIRNALAGFAIPHELLS